MLLGQYFLDIKGRRLMALGASAYQTSVEPVRMLENKLSHDSVPKGNKFWIVNCWDFLFANDTVTWVQGLGHEVIDFFFTEELVVSSCPLSLPWICIKTTEYWLPGREKILQRIILCRIKKLEEFEIDLGFILLVSHNSIVLISEPIFQVCTTELAQGLWSGQNA